MSANICKHQRTAHTIIRSNGRSIEFGGVNAVWVGNLFAFVVQNWKKSAVTLEVTNK